MSLSIHLGSLFLMISQTFLFITLINIFSHRILINLSYKFRIFIIMILTFILIFCCFISLFIEKLRLTLIRSSAVFFLESFKLVINIIFIFLYIGDIALRQIQILAFQLFFFKIYFRIIRYIFWNTVITFLNFIRISPLLI